ncbi:MAG: DNA-directed RNA polymerase subunit D [archaeon]
MKAELVEKNKEKIIFVIKESSPAFTNALRRIMAGRVPTMAIDEVEFRKNNSALYDEVVAHRIGLISLTTDLESYVLPSECKCNGEGCARCTLKLTLKEKGPKTVYASDFKSKDPKVKPVYPKTIITKLINEQEIELEATAVLGLGAVHSKWSPGLIHYKHAPNINIDDSKISNPEAVIAVCPVDVFEIKNKKLTLNEKNLLKCHDCEACVDVSTGAISIDYKNDYVFYIESWGQLAPADIAIQGTEVLDKKLDEFTEALK